MKLFLLVDQIIAEGVPGIFGFYLITPCLLVRNISLVLG